MASLNQDDVARILKILDESDMDELQLVDGDLKLFVKKRADGRSVPFTKDHAEGSSVPNDREGAASVSPSQEPQVETPMPPSESLEVEATAVSAGEEDGLLPIRAPMLGTFYSATKPGAPPFVQVDQSIEEGDTVCIIEVMKLFNTVKSGVRGRIKKICVEDAQMVEFGQVLFLVEKAFGEGNAKVKQT
ncbi:MAG: acetyl-CoA carboxylase, biotin carboxyl carrier protein [Deltaproteobacteria bacterium]|nr:acetyl-CoA carboxylase, biotin carboxyl carrier protein [Deltaproteobacteria bacterium]